LESSSNFNMQEIDYEIDNTLYKKLVLYAIMVNYDSESDNEKLKYDTLARMMIVL
ncbi:24725_t:CDS:2, partial [Racocetra persica]